MDYYKEKIEEIMISYSQISQMYINELDRAPEGNLIFQKNHGNDQFLHLYKHQGVSKRRSITKNPDMLRALAKKEFARRSLEIIEHNLKKISEAAKALIPFDPDEILQSMRPAYKKLPEEYFFDRDELVISHHLSDETSAKLRRHEAWGKQPYKQTDYYAEYRKVRTSRGLYVRSKSEALIAETLYRYGIPFHYDEEIMLGESQFAPDFTFEDADGQLFFWEHMGMMERENYATRNFRKLANYRANGILPGGRLLLSFDGDGTINMGTVDAIIKNEIIPRL